jgi:tripartite-type tricarboxylate transporter receptor subunit TctC
LLIAGKKERREEIMTAKCKGMVVGLSLLALLAAGFVSGAFAQGYPNKPIRVLVGWPAGGVADILPRIIAPKLTESLGQPIIIENKPGASSNIAAELAVKAAPDGYTLFLYSTPNSVNMTLYTKLSYDSLKDFIPVTNLASMANILVVHPSVPAHNVKELIALAKSKPGQLSFGSSGTGSTQHLSSQLLKTMAGVDIVHVPYKGSVPLMTALVSGEVPMAFNVISTVLPQIKAGKVRALAVSSAKRSPLAPDLPTVAEAALPGFEYVSYWGVTVPAGTPKEIVTKLNSEIVKVLRMPEMREKFASNGAEPIGDTPEHYGEFLRQEVVKTGKIVKESGAKAE